MNFKHAVRMEYKNTHHREEVSNVGGAKAIKAVLLVSCVYTAYRKVFLQTNVTNGKRALQRCAFRDLNSLNMKNHKWGTSYPHNVDILVLTQSGRWVSVRHPVMGTSCKKVVKLNYFSTKFF